MKLGTNDSLNHFDSCLVDDGNGGRQIKFTLKKIMPEAVGVPHTADHVSEHEDDEIDESVDNSFTRNEPLWRDRRRGIRLDNASECNEIVRQFLHIDFDESMVLTETERDDPKDTSVRKELTDAD